MNKKLVRHFINWRDFELIGARIPKWFRQSGVFNGGIQHQKDFWLNINCSPMKLLNFENWSSGEMSKIGHHFRNQSDLKINIIKNCQ